MPLNFNILATNFEELEIELEEAKKEAKKYTDFVELLQLQLETTKRNAEFKSAHPETEVVIGHQAPDGSPIRKRKGKTNNQIYEELILAFGQPMHVTDILDAARTAGVRQKGTAPPIKRLRNVLNGAKTRFYNVGNNHWWVVDKPLPEVELPSSYSHQQPRQEVAGLPAPHQP